ncbi:hypothetical protein YK48G_12890 [Lentilactobacillus fungorum]|uniref:Uncharacterized protein n=1 Tax=Lentilactobacillus fungorum TaxID=2201250 RepID=A0ABQ3W121_9LACO|nr:hypothetical protein YK48G_12890 [Lentilactobacillus fungorum]
MQILRSKRFERELKRLGKQRYPIELVVDCIQAIINKDQTTLSQIKDHS